MQDTPVSLLARLKQHPEEQHWRRFVLVFTPMLAAWARRLGVPTTDLEDVLQDLYTTLIRQLPEFEYNPSRSFRGWMWTILHRQVMAWRKKQFRERLANQEHFQELEDVSRVPEASEVVYQRMLLNRILQLVRQDFPERTWQIFLQLTLEGRSGKEVARQHGVSLNVVYLTRSRVLARIREQLAEFNF